jgi:hypothetical protein
MGKVRTCSLEVGSWVFDCMAELEFCNRVLRPVVAADSVGYVAGKDVHLLEVALGPFPSTWSGFFPGCWVLHRDLNRLVGSVGWMVSISGD